MSTSDPATPRRVLVVGGGMASLSCAYWLARQPDRFDVTVHQQGWRLGGKLASGRNLALHGRIEEHGLHVWSGFYENAFWMIREIYGELDRPPTHPLPTWDAAFSPWSNVSWFSSLDQHWVRVTDNVPSNDQRPGEIGRLASPAQLLARMVSFGPKLLEGYEPSTTSSSRGADVAPSDPLPPVTGLPSPPAADAHVSAGIRWLFDGFGEIAHLLEAGAAALSAELEAAAVALQQLTHRWLDELIEADSEWLEVIALIDLGLAYVRGFSRDGVFTGGFDVINHAELTEYLRGAGAHEITLGSGFVRGAYSYIFAFRDGDPARPDLEAGTALRMLLRLLLASSGAVFWRMNAGAGDTVVAPVYQALDRRGVDVEFFHVLRNVEVDPESKQVVAVEFGVQATPASGRYTPLIDLDGLEVWPTTPRYELLAQGAELQRRGVDLESAWNDWPDVSTLRLERGRDFDTLVLGLPPSSLELVAPDLVAASPALRAAVDAIPTVATQGVQLWMNPTSADLHAPQPATIATAFAPPIDTWADMSHLLTAEHWPLGEPPESLHYLCGVLPTAPAAPPTPDPSIPADVHRRAGVDLGNWLDQHAATLWPGAGTSPSSPGGFDPGVLYPAGTDPLDAQFWSTNIDPTARYCQSPVGSMSARPTPDGTGIDGLVVVGDWVRTGLDYGCIEAAVMAGLAGARAISGDDLAIYGETDFPPFRGPW